MNALPDSRTSTDAPDALSNVEVRRLLSGPSLEDDDDEVFDDEDFDEDDKPDEDEDDDEKDDDEEETWQVLRAA